MTCRICRYGFGLHLTTCPLSATARRPEVERRSDRATRAEYLAAVRADPEQKRELARARQRAYKARLREAKAS